MNHQNYRIFCIGRNYALHIKELNNATPESPVVFMKPLSSIVPEGEKIPYPKHGKQLEYEAELVVKIGKAGVPISLEDAKTFISGFTLGLDLTLRDLQNTLKNKGLPWEIAKAFDGSATLGAWTNIKDIGDTINVGADINRIDWQNISFQCYINHELRQEGHINDMIFSIPELILYLGQIWSLLPGDMIYTGTPAGVGVLNVGDCVELKSPQLGEFTWEVK